MDNNTENEEVEVSEVEAWEEGGNTVMLVIRMMDGSYWECGWDVADLERNGFYHVPEGC